MKKIVTTLILLTITCSAATPNQSNKTTPLNHKPNKLNVYSANAKLNLSANDIKAFLYSWFAMFDHQVPLQKFYEHLPQKNLSIHYPDMKIKTRKNFATWYGNVLKNIKFNSHDIYDMKVSGNDKDGWHAIYKVRWVGDMYSGAHIDMNVLQKAKIEIIKTKKGEKKPIITWLRVKEI